MRAARRFLSLTLPILYLSLLPIERVDALDPPYVPPPQPGMVAWDDNLIPQKMAQIYPGDLNPPFPYVTEGAFYDVGRLPNPIQGPATDYGDYRFRVTHIKFDYKTNFTTQTNPDGTTEIVSDNTEGYTLMFNSTTNLKHVVEDKEKGEWIYKYYTPETEENRGRCEPALYKTSTSGVKIQVRFECAAPVKYAYVGAKEMRDPQPTGTQNDQYPRKWLDVAKTAVPFMEKMPGKIWVTKGDQIGSDSQGNPIFSEYVTLPLVGATKAEVDRSDIVWQWYVDRINSTDELSNPNRQNEWTARIKNAGNKDGWAINKSGEYTTTTQTDDQGNTITLEIVNGHRFYTIINFSKYPWYDSYDNSNLEKEPGKQKPWVQALDYAIITPGKIRLQGKTTITSVATRVTEFCYKERQLEYNHLTGSAAFIYHAGNTMIGAITGNIGTLKLNLPFWLTNEDAVTRINCYDQALTVAAMTALIGGDAMPNFLEPFGYLKPSDFVGGVPRGNNCNNPFFENITVYASDGRVGDDDTYWRFLTGQQSNVHKRSWFISHSWMELNGLVYDATAGAANSDSPRTAVSRADFKAAAIDLTHTAVNPWEDNEELAITVTIVFDDHEVPISITYGPATDPGDPGATPPRDASNAPNPNYKNGDIDKTKKITYNLTLQQ
ncbi:MAG: hypothetical protein DPW14_10800 [Planctomycetes bacterium]|nr:hypothetical protein [Planctomycetota bacterium]